MRILFIIVFLTSSFVFSQEKFGSFATAIYLNFNGNKNFYSCTGNGIDKISDVDFKGNLGAFVRKSGKLRIAGAEIKSWNKEGANVCGGKMHFKLYQSSNKPNKSEFKTFDLPLDSNCNFFGMFENSEGVCSPGDKKWKIDSKNIDLTSLCKGNYTLEIYFTLNGSNSTENKCDETTFTNNKSKNYKIDFSIIDDFKVTISTPKSLLNTGETTQLFAQPSLIKDAYIYNWKAKNFKSTERNPIVKAGIYTLEVKNSCGSIAVSTIEIKSNFVKVKNDVKHIKKVKKSILKKETPKPILENKPKKVVEEPKKIIPVKIITPIIKEEIKPEPIIIEPKPEIIPENETIISEKKSNRNNLLVQSIQYKNPKIKLVIYDYGKDDGDLVTLFFNNKIVASEIEVKIEGRTFELILDQKLDQNELVFVANNLGSIPPNTSKVDIYIDGKVISKRLTTDELKNAQFIFKKK